MREVSAKVLSIQNQDKIMRIEVGSHGNGRQLNGMVVSRSVSRRLRNHKASLQTFRVAGRCVCVLGQEYTLNRYNSRLQRSLSMRSDFWWLKERRRATS